MPSSPNRILTTHVGSLVRTPELLPYLKKIEDGEPYDEAAFSDCLTDSVADVVHRQAAAGVDIVSDGEYGKTGNWAFYVHQRIAGFTERPSTPEEQKDPLITMSRGHDFVDFPEFYAEYFPTQGFKVRSIAVTTVCNAPIRYIGQAQVQRDIANLKAALAKVNVPGVSRVTTSDGFLPVVAPGSAFPIFKNEYYSDDQSMLWALAEACREEYKTILDAGLRVQIDDAFLPWTYERLVPPMTMQDYRKWAELRIEALNHTLEGLPQDRIRYHICWGSWNAPHTHDVPLKDIVDLLLKLRVGAYQFEAGNVRHEHEWKVWKDVKLPEDRVLIPGVISHVTNVVEHPELVAERLIRFAEIVGRERVMAGSDCGFAQAPMTRRVHPTIQWAKLRAQAEGARIASAKLWGQTAAS